MDLEKQKERFKNHIAKFFDYGNIKILDFKAPGTSNYRIRFLFEEDYYRLHISGDLGELVATNYNNMCWNEFEDFINNPEYFEEKIDCCSSPLHEYDYDLACKQMSELIEKYEIKERIKDECAFESEEAFNAEFNKWIGDVLSDFTKTNGIGWEGYEAGSRFIDDFWEDCKIIGKKPTGVIDRYMLAFKLAKAQVLAQQKAGE